MRNHPNRCFGDAVGFQHYTRKVIWRKDFERERVSLFFGRLRYILQEYIIILSRTQKTCISSNFSLTSCFPIKKWLFFIASKSRIFCIRTFEVSLLNNYLEI